LRIPQIDYDGDGFRDGDEPGLPGWTVELSGISGGLLQTLVSSTPPDGTRFGKSVALVGNNVAVGTCLFDGATGDLLTPRAGRPRLA